MRHIQKEILSGEGRVVRTEPYLVFHVQQPNITDQCFFQSVSLLSKKMHSTDPRTMQKNMQVGGEVCACV